MSIFSFTLPMHTAEMHTNDAVFYEWRAAYDSGANVLSALVRNAATALHFLHEKRYFGNTHNVCLAGLSRRSLPDGFVSEAYKKHTETVNIAALLAFAPVTVILALSELSDTALASPRAKKRIATASSLRNEVFLQLVEVPLRVNMGISDLLDGTLHAF